jgi:hypothetical protein
MNNDYFITRKSDRVRTAVLRRSKICLFPKIYSIFLNAMRILSIKEYIVIFVVTCDVFLNPDI